MADKHGQFPDSWSSEHEGPSLSSQPHNEREHRSDSDSESSYVSTDEEDETEKHHSLSEVGHSQPAALLQHGKSTAPAARSRASETRLAEETRGVSGFGLGHSLSISGAAFVQGVAAEERASVSYLQSLGPMNPLVRPSLVQQHERRGELNAESVLRPVLADSGLRFTDLFLNPNTQNVENVVSPSFNLCLIRALHVPITGVARPVLRRTARICLFDGARLVGNSVAMQGKTPKRDVEAWIFSPKPAGNQCLVRSNLDPAVYIELNVCYDASAEEATGALNRPSSRADYSQVDEVTCAHATFQFPKTPNVGKQLAEDREFVVNLMGGSLWAPVDLQELAKREGRSASLWTRLAAKPPKPTLRLRISRLSQADLQQSKSLPGTILATPSQLPFFAMYRQLSARCLLAHTHSVGAAVLASALALFPKVADDPQLFEALLGLWQKRASFVTRVEQAKADVHLVQFQRCLLQVWPLMQTRELPPRGMSSDSLGQEARASVIRKYMQHSAGENLSSGQGRWMHKPFDSRELVFDWQNRKTS